MLAVRTRVRTTRCRRVTTLALLGIAGFGGWSCASSRSADSNPRVVALDQLPERERAVWEAWQKGGARWELERDRVRADPQLARFLVDNLVRTLVKSYDRAQLARAGQQNGPFERASAELVALAEHSTPVLDGLLAVPDGIVAFLAADVLARIGAPALPYVSARLEGGLPETRRRAAELCERLPHAAQGEIELQQRLAKLVEHDEAWIVRAQAARALGARGSRHDHKGYALGVLGRALADADVAVVENAAAGLAALGERRAVPVLARALRPAAQKGQVKGVRAIQGALRALTGVREDLEPEAWLDWFDRHPPPPLPALESR